MCVNAVYMGKVYMHMKCRGQEGVLGDLPYHSLHFFFEARALSMPRDGVLSAILKPKFPAFLLSLNHKALYYTCM